MGTRARFYVRATFKLPHGGRALDMAEKLRELAGTYEFTELGEIETRWQAIGTRERVLTQARATWKEAGFQPITLVVELADP